MWAYIINFNLFTLVIFHCCFPLSSINLWTSRHSIVWWISIRQQANLHLSKHSVIHAVLTCLFYLVIYNYSSISEALCLDAMQCIGAAECLINIVGRRTQKALRILALQPHTRWVIKHQYYSLITSVIVGQFSTFFHPYTPQEICNKTLSCFTPQINYVPTLPCETKNATLIILPLQLLQKLTSKFIYFFT